MRLLNDLARFRSIILIESTSRPKKSAAQKCSHFGIKLPLSAIKYIIDDWSVALKI